MGNAFLYGNGGGTELAIKIVGGTQRPETGKQGTIWINTDQKITGWTIQVQEPTNPTEGIVWIYNQTSAKLNVLKKNGIWFTPTSAKQYIGGAWVKKTGEYYNNGQWVALFAATIHVTYPAGSTCTATDGVTTLTAPDKSGTWDCVVPNAGAWTFYMVSGEKEYQEDIEISANNQDVTIELEYKVVLNIDANNWIKTGTISRLTIENVDDGVKATVTKASGTGGYVSQAVDLTQYTTVSFDHTQYRSSTNAVAWHFVIYDSSLSKVVNKAYYSSGVITLDCSALTGEYYIGFYGDMGSSANGYVIFKSIVIT